MFGGFFLLGQASICKQDKTVRACGGRQERERERERDGQRSLSSKERVLTKQLFFCGFLVVCVVGGGRSPEVVRKKKRDPQGSGVPSRVLGAGTLRPARGGSTKTKTETNPNKRNKQTDNKRIEHQVPRDCPLFWAVFAPPPSFLG